METNEKKEIYLRYLILKKKTIRNYIFLIVALAILLFSSFFVGQIALYYFYPPTWMWEDTLVEIINYMSIEYGKALNIYLILFIPGLFCTIFLVLLLVELKRLNSEFDPFIIAEMKSHMKSFKKRGINININSDITHKDK